MLNRELLKNTMALIKYKPETHNQSTWVTMDDSSPCGTTMCFAGHAAVLAGAEIPDPTKHLVADWYIRKSDLAYLNYQAAAGTSMSERKSVREFAKDNLGIIDMEANYLFDGDRTVEEIELAVQELLEYGSILTYSSQADDEYDYYDYYDDGCDCDECS